MCIQEAYSDFCIVYHRYEIIFELHSLIMYLYFMRCMYPQIIGVNCV